MQVSRPFMPYAPNRSHWLQTSLDHNISYYESVDTPSLTGPLILTSRSDDFDCGDWLLYVVSTEVVVNMPSLRVSRRLSANVLRVGGLPYMEGSGSRLSL